MKIFIYYKPTNMNEYTPTDARRDAGRFISDCFFNVKLTYAHEDKENVIWLPVTALNKEDAIQKVITWAESFGINNMTTTAYPTLNAIEETIK